MPAPTEPAPQPDPEGKAFGLPYDWRPLSWQRVKSRAWNPADRRMFTPKTFGWGLGINGYWLAHPLRYWQGRRSSRFHGPGPR